MYRWKGLYGQQTDGSVLDTSPGAFQDWSLGVNVQVPLGLRQGRAAQRQVELALARDRANLDQGRHAAVHQLATTTRLIDQTYEQFLAFTEARKAARQNLQYQMALFENGRTIYLNVLQAITDWGNTISSEANSLTQYNTQLAALERQTGTILETHGVYFYEEQFASTGWSGRLGSDRCYPLSLRPDYPGSRYPAANRPADESFELEKPQSAFGEDPLPELQYDREPAGSGEGVDPGMLPREPALPAPGDRLPGDLPGLPELPELPGPPPAARTRGSATGIPLPPVSGANAEDDDALAGAAKPLPRRLGRGLPVGQNRLQQPERVTPVGGEADPRLEDASRRRVVGATGENRPASNRTEPGRSESRPRVSLGPSATGASATGRSGPAAGAAERAGWVPGGAI
ncbi:MAG: TolC family protein, partial [Planctomycetaceae bacterium]